MTPAPHKQMVDMARLLLGAPVAFTGHISGRTGTQHMHQQFERGSLQIDRTPDADEVVTITLAPIR